MSRSRRVDLQEVAPWLLEVDGTRSAPLDWEALLPGCSGPVAVEFGCGYGDFLRGLAAGQPGCPFVGVETMRGAALRCSRKLMRANLANARVVVGDAFWVLHDLFARGTVGNVYINFPDPWPKRRHAWRRYVRQPFVDELHRKMVAGRRVFLATDVFEYAEEMAALFGAHSGFASRVDAPGYSHRKPTTVYSKYERDFLAQGLPVYYLVYESR